MCFSVRAWRPILCLCGWNSVLQYIQMEACVPGLCLNHGNSISHSFLNVLGVLVSSYTDHFPMMSALRTNKMRWYTFHSTIVPVQQLKNTTNKKLIFLQWYWHLFCPFSYQLHPYINFRQFVHTPFWVFILPFEDHVNLTVEKPMRSASMLLRNTENKTYLYLYLCL